MKKSLKELIILGIKTCLYASLIAIFFVVFESRNVALEHISRTTVITSMTFIILISLMALVYGGVAIGKRKSKPIIYSMVISVFITDVVTYLQLMIMNTNPNNNAKFQLEQLDLLLLTFILQVIAIVLITRVGNFIYFKMHSTQNVLIITTDMESLSLKKIKAYYASHQLQFKIGDVVDVDAVDLKRLTNYEHVVFVNVPYEKRHMITNQCYLNKISFAFSPNVVDIVEMSGEDVVFGDVPMVLVEKDDLTVEQKVAKRTLDIVIALVGIIVSSPIWIVSAIAIKLGDGGPVLFTQKRYTMNGELFKIYKFRTMKNNVENYSSTSDDDRITPVGRVLRKIRMDELPQLINILKGEMSMVGPRPEMLENVEKYENELPEFRYRLRVKAGLTGIAQIEGKYNTAPYDKLIMDLVYIENYSVWSDIKLILRTVIVLFKKDSTAGFEEDKSGK